MASVEIEIGSRRYQVACRAGEEAHLRSVAALVDHKARDAAGALGTLSEARQLLFASLLLADELQEKGKGAPAPAAPAPPSTPAPVAQADSADDDFVADALERLAARIEALAEKLET
jgi:cell division protein ZapA